MKSIGMLAILMVMLGVGTVQGSSLDVDYIDGVWVDDDGQLGVPGATYIVPNETVVYYLRAISTESSKVAGMTNGFQVYSPDGASWSPVVLEDVYPGGLGLLFDLVSALNAFSVDGSGADTVGYGGSLISGPGLAPGFDDIVLSITTGVDLSQEGKTLCLDSSFYPPSGLWLWAGSFGTSAPDWGGPYCYKVAQRVGIPPQITNCPVTAYTGSHCDAVSYDFDAEDEDPVAPFTFSISDGVGSIDPATGVWSYAPSLADVGSALFVEVVATDEAGDSDPCRYDLAFTNAGPSFTGGCGATYFSGADQETAWTVTAEDGDCDPTTTLLLDVTPTPDGVWNDNGNGSVDFTPTINDTGSVFTFTFAVTDGPDSAFCEVYVDVKGETNFEIVIEDDHGDAYYPHGVIQGQHAFVDVTMEAGSEVPAGFDFLISYDASVLFFQSALSGSDFYIGGCGWEYFSYRFGPFGNCGSACPSGMIRIVGIAETNNGPNHPDCLKPNLPAKIFSLDFLVSNDRTYECQFALIRFYWLDCGDNSLAYYPLTAMDSVVQGIEASVWNYYSGVGEAATYIEVTSVPTSFPTGFGAPDECLTQNEDPNKPHPNRIIDFYNGGIRIICSEDIDARGDVNLNGESNEIADAVLFSNYFVMGLDVFKVNIDGQIAATDVNADGLTLSVADLVYLTRVIVGDALPISKLTTVEVAYSHTDGVVSVEREMGGAFMTVAGNVTPKLLARDMEMKYAYRDGQTRILVSSLEGRSFSGDMVEVDGELLSIEMATSDGAMAVLNALPSEFGLSQNYPNPFNPTTTIGFALKHAGHVERCRSGERSLFLQV